MNIGKVGTHEFYTKVEVTADTCEPTTVVSLYIPRSRCKSDDTAPMEQSSVGRSRQGDWVEQCTSMWGAAEEGDPTQRMELWNKVLKGEGMKDSRKFEVDDDGIGNLAEYHQCKTTIEMQYRIQRLRREILKLRSLASKCRGGAGRFASKSQALALSLVSFGRGEAGLARVEGSTPRGRDESQVAHSAWDSAQNPQRS